jgi:RNA polymerase sigma-70 factor, ECF subfamily
LRRLSKREEFERIMIPHLDAAYGLARWLMRDGPQAEDVVQSAYLRAFESFETYKHHNAIAWILTIVRNTAYTTLRRQRPGNLVSFDEALHTAQSDNPFVSAQPEAQTLAAADRELLRTALLALPEEFREVLILRELEGLSYQEIAEVTGAPAGTVMSRLSRARRQLQQAFLNLNQKVSNHEL